MLKSYEIIRNKSYSLSGFEYKFILKDDDNQIIYNTKAIKNNFNQILLYEQKENFSEYILYSNDELTSFSLLTNNDILLLSFSSTPPKIDLKISQKSKIIIFQNFNIENIELISKNPELLLNKFWVYDFGSKFSINSIKNCIYYLKKTNQEVISIRKTNKNILTIDISIEIPHQIIFSIGIIHFIGKK